MNCQICGAPLPVGAMFCGECGSSSTATPKTRKRPDPRPNDTTIIQRLPRRPRVISVPVVTAAAVPPPGPAPAPAPEPARAAPSAPAPRRFDLLFSTGERFSVLGSGLVGRRPLPQPSENFDHLIQITDAGRSVSKSHLEFGQHDGEFWLSDRFSGNGTVILRPGEAATRCEPGRRYLVPRGSRVELADQFFVLR